ncbi:MAG: hypothetical protein WBH03_24380 [Cyclobacteriaceae bacterium]
MKKKKIDPEKIILSGLRIIKASFEINADHMDDQQVIDNINIGLKSESAFNFEEKNHRFRLFFKVTGREGEESKMVCEADYGIEFHYHIENLEDFLIKDDEMPGCYSVDGALGATIAGISYSTSRGIILERTQTTDFRGVILPVIDPGKLLQGDSYSNMNTAKPGNTDQ